MRIFFIVFLLTFVHSKKKSDYESSVSETSEESDYMADVSTTIDHRGDIRKYLAVEIALASDGENMVCSPISALLPVAKLVLGTKKHSKIEAELLDGLGLKTRKELRPAYKQLIKDLEYMQGVEISLASRLFLSSKRRLKSKFKHASNSIFGSSVEMVDMKKRRETAALINKWVYDHTNKKISEVMEESDIDPEASVIMANAIYFKGRWKDPFPPAENLLFHGADGTQYQTAMMSRSGSYNYVKHDELKVQILELPYLGEQAAMIILLPFEKNGLPILLRTLKLSPHLLNDALKRMKTAKVEVTIPKFKIATSIDLKHFYKKVGLKKTMSEKSGIDYMVKDKTVHISMAKQKAIIEVHECGTKAAAATVAGMLPILNLNNDQIVFTANHPFLFYVKANFEQIFAGVINKPK